MLGDTSDGLTVLQSMEIVGVGGAALPETVGDRLVKENVNLVSRFGSAECGFLLSSHREYASDKDWQYLRLPDSTHLLFELEESGLSELIVLSSWPHMAKRNRGDGSYATSDLFQPHPDIKNAWKYHSRSDSQITLLTGKKFDPAPIEDEIKSQSANIDDIFIFGNDKQVPGAIVFVSRDVTDTLKEEIWVTFKQVNTTQQPHARVSQTMIDIVCKPDAPLERSSKGTLLRTQAEQRYASNIRRLYEPKQAAENTDQPLSNGSVDDIVRKIFADVVGGDTFADDADFFHCGVDSTKATQIRSRLQDVC